MGFSGRTDALNKGAIRFSIQSEGSSLEIAEHWVKKSVDF
jgi:hypothetical protein